MPGFSTTLLSTAVAAAEAAAEVHRRHSARMSRVGVSEASEKGRADYVSAVDLEAEEVSLAIIRQRFPDHAILAEESHADGAEITLASDVPTWIVDPLDGTANYLHGHPMFASSVAVAIDGYPVASLLLIFGIYTLRMFRRRRKLKEEISNSSRSPFLTGIFSFSFAMG